MAHFAGRREIGLTFPIQAASVDPKNTTHNHDGMADQYRRKNALVSSLRAKTSRNYEKAGSTPPKLEEHARQVGAEAAFFWCPFFDFGGWHKFSHSVSRSFRMQATTLFLRYSQGRELCAFGVY